MDENCTIGNDVKRLQIESEIMANWVLLMRCDGEWEIAQFYVVISFCGLSFRASDYRAHQR